MDWKHSRRPRAGADSGGEHNGKESGCTVHTQKGMTLSGLLNVLDGFHAPSGVLFVMTTNHVEKLDNALLRPGRIDYKLYLGKATDHQKLELYRRFFPDSSEMEARGFVEASRSSETMAEFQGLLLALEQGGGRMAGSGCERLTNSDAELACLADMDSVEEQSQDQFRLQAAIVD